MTRRLNHFHPKITQPIDIMMSHDWPRGIYHYGNKEQLLREKTFFKDEVDSNTLGKNVKTNYYLNSMGHNFDSTMGSKQYVS